MPPEPGAKRTDSASRVIHAPPEKIYAACVDPAALVAWLPPRGMTGHIHTFHPRPGGTYRIELTYDAPHPDTPGKASENSDIAAGRFVEVVPNQRLVQLVEFESSDPAFAGTMKMTWSLRPVPTGTEVTFLCEDVPVGISAEDHAEGLSSSLENLAGFLEG